MSITTPLDIIAQAFRRSMLIGEGQTLPAEQANDAFDSMNGFIDQWNLRGLLVWAKDDVACTSTGAISYTIGTGQDFNTPRPDRIEAAYVRQLPVSNDQPYDTYLNIIDSHEDYAAIPLKNIVTWPTNVFYDSQFPVGNIFVWPIPPSQQFEVHLILKHQIVPFTSLAQNITNAIPPAYLEALSWNLAARLRPAYGLPADPQTTALALNALNTLRMANLQPSVVKMPYGYPRNGVYGYGWPLGISGGFA